MENTEFSRICRFLKLLVNEGFLAVKTGCKLCHLSNSIIRRLVCKCKYMCLVYTLTVDSVFRALRLATQSVNILHYSLIHLQFLRASDAKLAYILLHLNDYHYAKI